MSPAVLRAAVFSPAVLRAAVFSPAVLRAAVFSPAVLRAAVFGPAVLGPAALRPAPVPRPRRLASRARSNLPSGQRGCYAGEHPCYRAFLTVKRVL